MSSPLFTVSLAPHVRAPVTVSRIMWAVSIALLPALIAGALVNGPRAIIVSLVAVAASVVTEDLACRLFLKRPTTVADGSAVVTGLLLAFNVPASIPLWQVIIGAIVAIGIAKMAFGGIGNNPFNPALVGRAFMLVSFPVDMTSWPAPGTLGLFGGADAVTTATPLGILKEAGAGALATVELPSYGALFFGTVGDCIGAASALAVLIGGILLVIPGMVKWQVPVAFLAGLGLFTGIFWLIDPTTYADPLYHVLAGGAMLAAFFMVTDMTTTPMSLAGRIIFAGAAGILTGIIRLFGGFPEGASYAILIMNAFVPVIDRHLKPRRFGRVARSGAAS